jgi:hypothetical protein
MFPQSCKRFISCLLGSLTSDGSRKPGVIEFFTERGSVASRRLWNTINGRRIVVFGLTTTGVVLLFAGAAAQEKGPNKEPIAYIGHGAFFDASGKEIDVTLEFVATAQNWYRAKLLESLPVAKKSEFAQAEGKLMTSSRAEGQSKLVVQQRSLDWLLARSLETTTDARTAGKIRALKYALQWKLPERSGTKDFERREMFKLDPNLEGLLKLPEFDPKIGATTLSATINSGQAYINECMAAGVPIPPPIGKLDPAGLTGWKTQGFIPPGDQFIVLTPAEVRTYQSTSPVGVCIALPRYSNASKTTVALDGVICLGQASSAVCFWDNQMGGNGFSFPAGDQIPIGVPDLSIDPQGRYQAGGFELEGGSGGMCTDCHAGQNPYVIHPKVDLGNGLRMEQLGQSPLNLPMFSAARYDPLVPASWPQNQLSHSPPLVPSVCAACHFSGGPGGAFPHLSSELIGYCNTILPKAISKTMPPGNPGGEVGNPAVAAFQAWCNSAASAGPSTRGDPHLTTTNGINYDFQSAGEFTTLRNSASGFELQTRQTPVSTTFTPGPNAYTGLASCVSLNTAVAVRVGKHRLTYEPTGRETKEERLQLRLDGRLITIPRNGLNLGNGNIVTKADSSGGLNINLSDGTHLIVTPNYWTSEGYWYLNVEVLSTPAREGTMGHIPAGSWLPLAPDGSPFGPAPNSLPARHILLNQKFADAWRVTPATSLFDYLSGTSTGTFTDRAWPPAPGQPCKDARTARQPVKPMGRDLAVKMCREIKDKAAYDNCVFDLTATGDAGMVKAYLRSIKLLQDAAPAAP